MNSYLYTLLKTATILFLIDIIWIATGGIFGRHLAEKIQGKPLSIRYGSAAAVYLFLAYMLLETTTYKQAFIYGICIYAVYDFTTLAILDDYDWKFALTDTLWGGILFVFARYILKNVV